MRGKGELAGGWRLGGGGGGGSKIEASQQGKEASSPHAAPHKQQREEIAEARKDARIVDLAQLDHKTTEED